MARRPRPFLPILVLAVFAAPGAAAAQEGFLFDEPRITVGLRVGGAFQSADSDLFDDFRTRLTLDRGDFSGATFAGDIGIRLSSHLDLTLGAAYASTSASSEYRDWVKQDDSPILQTTELTRTPLTASLKFYPLDRGRSIGTRAWIPTSFAPFLGGGVGTTRYSLSQSGEFVDENSFDIFPATLESEGSATTWHVLAGADYWFASRLGLTLEGRYSGGSGELEGNFPGWELDLSGFQATAGLAVRF